MNKRVDNWYSLSGEKIPNILEAIKMCITQYIKDGEVDRCSIMIGTDSQRRGKSVIYVTAIAILKKGCGGRAFYTRCYDDVPGITDHMNITQRRNLIKGYIIPRLWHETILSVDYANIINEYIKDTGVKILDIHCDINPNKKYKSSDICKATSGYVQGSGYNCIVKPDGWVASCISNSKTK